MRPMQRLNKLLIQQQDIFLAPGSYFHSEFNGDFYHQLPVLLQEQHNHKLIEQYALPSANPRTPLLPNVLSIHWKQLPIVAVHIGGVMQTESQQQSRKLPNSETLRRYFRRPLNAQDILNNNAPTALIALGAAKVLSSLAPFGSAYILRAKYMFNREIQQMIPAHRETMLPWNIIEEICHYINRNKNNENTAIS